MENQNKIKIKNIKIYAIDLDGVISRYFGCVPYTGMKKILKYLWNNGENVLFLASFNPNAKNILMYHGLDYMFSCFRSGANSGWEPPYLESNMKTMNKTIQIHNMMIEYEEQYKSRLEYCQQIKIKYEVIFFDDTVFNLNQVESNLQRIGKVSNLDILRVSCYRISPYCGLDIDTLVHLYRNDDIINKINSGGDSFDLLEKKIQYDIQYENEIELNNRLNDKIFFSHNGLLSIFKNENSHMITLIHQYLI